MKHNNLDYHNFLKNISINYKIYTLKAWHKSKKNYMFKAFKPWKWTIFIFSNILFSLPNVHHSFWKLKTILTLMIRRAKGLELMKIIFIINLSTFAQKCFWPWKIIDFQNVL
jgi:hypothetical protein